MADLAVTPTVELQAFVDAERRKAVTVGAIVGFAGGFALAHFVGKTRGNTDVLMGLGLGVLASALANVITKHTGVA